MGSEAAMKRRSAKIAVHVVIFVVLIVVMSAVSIWLGTGPVVLSP
jgi:t-SNARE complex subunit (syntaxin)